MTISPKREVELDPESVPGVLLEHLRQQSVGELEFAAGSVIFEENADAHEAYFLAAGSVCIHKRSADGQTRLLGRVRRGELFGEMALLQRCKRSASAQAETDCCVFVIPRQQLLELVTQVPRLAFWLLLDFSRRLRRADSAILQMESSQAVNARILESQDAERARVAREIEDGVMQHLAAHVLEAQSSLHMPRSVQDLQAEIQRLRGGMIDVMNHLKNVVTAVAGETLQSGKLRGALVRYVGTVQAEYGMQITLACPSIPDGLLSDQEQHTVMYIVQGAVFAAANYARAQQAELSLGIDKGMLRVVAMDDGAGIDAEAAGQGFHQPEVAIFDAMRERARLIGGSMKLRSEPGHGTVVEVEIPLAGPAQTA